MTGEVARYGPRTLVGPPRFPGLHTFRSSNGARSAQTGGAAAPPPPQQGGESNLRLPHNEARKRDSLLSHTTLLGLVSSQYCSTNEGQRKQPNGSANAASDHLIICRETRKRYTPPARAIRRAHGFTITKPAGRAHAPSSEFQDIIHSTAKEAHNKGPPQT